MQCWLCGTLPSTVRYDTCRCMRPVQFGRRLPQHQQAEGAGPLLVAPIYASLPAAQQLRIFEPAPAGTRKVCV